MKNLRNVVLWFGTLVAVLLTAQVSDAQVVPFKSTGSNNVYTPADGAFGGQGITSHMGVTVGSGIATPSDTLNPLIKDWFGGGEFVAANGDKLYFYGGGTVYLEPLGGTMFKARWIGKFYVYGGTGRFQNASAAAEPLDVVAVNHPFDIVGDAEWLYDYVITGEIDLGKRKN